MAARFLPLAARRDVIASRQSNDAPSPHGPAKESYTFPRETRLVRKSEYDAVYRTAKRRSSSHFTIFVRANALPVTRFGFSIKKALGGAVVRNRIRRRMREMVRLNRQEIPAGWDIVVHPKSSVAKDPFVLMTGELVRLLKTL